VRSKDGLLTFLFDRLRMKRYKFNGNGKQGGPHKIMGCVVTRLQLEGHSLVSV
jgi:hypothetical protein